MIVDIRSSVKELNACKPDQIPEQVQQSESPLILRGLASAWPAVREGNKSPAALCDYLRRFYQGAPVTASIGPPEVQGRIFYNEDMTGFNFQPKRLQLNAVLEQLLAYQNDATPPVYYVGSTSVEQCLPGFRAENDLALEESQPMVRLWIGNRTRIAAHYDIPNNIACVVAGRRRVVLFPPQQLQNLYIGPLDFAPAGQAISLVDFHKPDFDRYPRFREALQHAQLAELNPGDAILIPSMWWHHIESLDSVNMLVNYWWRQSPAFMGSPLEVLNHALLSIRDLPDAQRKAWRNLFDYYIFQEDADAASHIPEASRGVLSAIDEIKARKLRAQLLNQLNR